jgi:hypothetical protein
VKDEADGERLQQVAALILAARLGLVLLLYNADRTRADGEAPRSALPELRMRIELKMHRGRGRTGMSS